MNKMERERKISDIQIKNILNLLVYFLQKHEYNNAQYEAWKLRQLLNRNPEEVRESVFDFADQILKEFEKVNERYNSVTKQGDDLSKKISSFYGRT